MLAAVERFLGHFHSADFLSAHRRRCFLEEFFYCARKEKAHFARALTVCSGIHVLLSRAIGKSGPRAQDNREELAVLFPAAS